MVQLESSLSQKIASNALTSRLALLHSSVDSLLSDITVLESRISNLDDARPLFKSVLAALDQKISSQGYQDKIDDSLSSLDDLDSDIVQLYSLLYNIEDQVLLLN